MSAWIEQEGRDLKFPAYVWQAPVRLWHWTMALAMVVLWVTGYFIGSPLPSVPGEASENFLMGYIRFAHFSAGYVLRSVDLFPQQGTSGPWTVEMDYRSDHARLRKGSVEDPRDAVEGATVRLEDQ